MDEILQASRHSDSGILSQRLSGYAWRLVWARLDQKASIIIETGIKRVDPRRKAVYPPFSRPPAAPQVIFPLGQTPRIIRVYSAYTLGHKVAWRPPAQGYQKGAVIDNRVIRKDPL